MQSSVLQSIGKTPILKLKLSKDLPGTVWLKLENQNPGGSIKDRVAFHCLERAVKRGELRDRMVAATSGNLGIGCALVCAAWGLECFLTMPESMSMERRALLAGYGARLVLTPAEEGMAGAVGRAAEMAEKEGAWLFDQFSSPNAVEAHYYTTGREINHDSSGNMNVLVAGVGSGSSITGAGLYLKEVIRDFRVIAVEPAESPVLSGGRPGPHKIQGIGAGFVPKVLNTEILDEILTVKGDDAIDMARKVMKHEGVCYGISSGANVFAALSVAGRPEMAGMNIITFACDTGERYLSTPLFAQ